MSNQESKLTNPCPCGTQRCYPEHCSAFIAYENQESSRGVDVDTMIEDAIDDKDLYAKHYATEFDDIRKEIKQLIKQYAMELVGETDRWQHTAKHTIRKEQLAKIDRDFTNKK